MHSNEYKQGWYWSSGSWYTLEFILKNVVKLEIFDTQTVVGV